MRSSNLSRGSFRFALRSLLISAPAQPPIAACLSFSFNSPASLQVPRINAARNDSRFDSRFAPPKPAAISALGEPRQPHHKLSFDHLKLGPGQLHGACSQRQVHSVAPFRLNQPSQFERQKIPHSEVAQRDGHIEFDRKPVNRRTKSPRVWLHFCARNRRRSWNESPLLHFFSSQLSAGRCSLRGLSCSTWNRWPPARLHIWRLPGSFHTLTRLSLSARRWCRSHTQQVGAAK